MPTVDDLLGPPPAPKVDDLLGPPPEKRQAKVSTFVPVKDFHSAVDQVVGSGKWRPTGDYRTPGREAQLTAEGAATARGVSHHTLGTPDAPGAHDLVIPGMSQSQAIATLKRIPGVDNVIYEGPAGGQGGHYHVNMKAGVAALPKADDLLGPPPGGATHGSEADRLLGPPPAAEQPASGGGDRRASGGLAGLVAGTTRPQQGPLDQIGLTDIAHSAAAGQHRANEALNQDVNHLLETPKNAGDALDRMKKLGEGGGAKIGMDALGAPFGWLQGALESFPGKSVQKDTGGKVAPSDTAALIQLAVPFLGEARQATAAADLAKEAGISVNAAHHALDAARTTEAARLASAKAGVGKDFEPEKVTKMTPARKAGAAETARQKALPAELASGPAKAPRPRLQTLAEARSTARLTPHRETPLLDEGKPGEPVKATLTRHEDGLYRLQNAVEADKVETDHTLNDFGLDKKQAKRLNMIVEHHQQFGGDAEDVPEDLRGAYDIRMMSAADKERLYHAVEAGDPIPDDLKPAAEVLNKRRAVAADLWKEVQAMRPPKEGEEDEGPPPDDPNHIHRIRADKPGMFNQSDRKDPITGGLLRPPTKSISRQASSLNARKYFMLEDANGKRVPAPKKEAGAEPWKAGDTHVGSNGRTYTVKPATTLEIESIDPEAKYIKEPFVNTEQEILDLRRVKRNIEYMNTVVPDLVDRDLAVRKEWRYKDADGKWQVAHSNQEVLDGWKQVDGIPELKGVYFHPRIAAMFKDYVNASPDEPAWRMLQNANRLMVGAMFWNPVKHDLNIANMWTIGRGWDWVTPKGWGSLLRNGTRAIQSVLMQDDDYTRALREGLPLQFSRAANADFYKMMIRKAGMEIAENPTGWDKIAKTMGFKGTKDLVEAYYREAQKAMWKAGDMMLMQRWFELMDNQGMSMEQARVQAGKEIADYRIPTEAFGHRAVSNFLNNKLVTVFNNYHYNIFKAYASMVHDAAGKGGTEAQKQAAGRLFVMGVMAFVAAPIANKALQAATGNKNAKVQGAGLSVLPDRLIDLSKGQTEAADVLGSYITMAPAADTMLEWTHGRGKDWTGKDIIEPAASPLGKAAEAAEYGAGKISPVQTLEQATKDPFGTIASQVDISLPTPKKMSGEEYAEHLRRRRAAKREAKDPLENLIKRTIGQ